MSDGPILDQYDACFNLLKDHCRAMEDLVSTLLSEEGLRVHSVTSRVKERSSLERKLGRLTTTPTSLEDIYDVVGVRIITHFADEVDTVAAFIEREFAIDWDRSSDKRALLDPDRFGYLSRHYVLSLDDVRSRLGEYRRFSGKPAEVQMRSILQHAWAEIEHDLGYKAETEVPREIRRRFSRLAGLLELADEEFESVRDDLEAYADTVPARVVAEPAGTFIDRESVVAFIESNAGVAELDRKIVEGVGVELRDEVFGGTRSRELQSLGLRTIEDVVEALDARSDLALRFALAWLSGARSRAEAAGDDMPRFVESGLSRGTSLYFLCLTYVAARGSVDAVVDWYDEIGLGDPEERAEYAARLIETYAEVSGQEL